jgi:hypothetical protein
VWRKAADSVNKISHSNGGVLTERLLLYHQKYSVNQFDILDKVV